jgi:hypothetical protein
MRSISTTGGSKHFTLSVSQGGLEYSRRPDGAEFSVIENEIAYVFPSDAGLTCVALSVNLDAYAQLR